MSLHVMLPFCCCVTVRTLSLWLTLTLTNQCIMFGSNMPGQVIRSGSCVIAKRTFELLVGRLWFSAAIVIDIIRNRPWFGAVSFSPIDLFCLWNINFFRSFSLSRGYIEAFISFDILNFFCWIVLTCRVT